MTAPRAALLPAVVLALTAAIVACSERAVEGPYTWGSAAGVKKYANLYLAGQPDTAGLVAAREAGVGVVVNLRHPTEHRWDEAAAAAELGLAYHSVPVSGNALSREALERVDAIVAENEGEEILIHCASGNRVGAWLAIHLVERRGMEPEQALAIGREAGITKDGLAAGVIRYLEESGP